MEEGKTCVHISGCNNKGISGRWLCRKHREETKLDGTRDNYPKVVNAPPRGKTLITKECEAEDCSRLARSNVGKWCDKHDARFRRTGSVELPEDARIMDPESVGDSLVCTSCKVEKDISNFKKRKSSTTDKTIWVRRCNDCVKVVVDRRLEFNKTRPDLFIGEKCCQRCKINKPKTDFCRTATSSDGLNSNCNQCRREMSLIKKYGITAKEYDRMWDAQDGKCAICGLQESMIHHMNGEIKMLAVDHDHETGKIRSLLCHSCNVGLGYFRDSPDMLRIAAIYLEGHNGLH